MGRPRVDFGPKNMTFEVPFGIDFSIFSTIDFGPIFYRFSVVFIFVKSHFRWGRVAKIIVLQVPEFNGFFVDLGINFSPQIRDFPIDFS